MEETLGELGGHDRGSSNGSSYGNVYGNLVISTLGESLGTGGERDIGSYGGCLNRSGERSPLVESLGSEYGVEGGSYGKMSCG